MTKRQSIFEKLAIKYNEHILDGGDAFCFWLSCFGALTDEDLQSLYDDKEMWAEMKAELDDEKRKMQDD